MSLIVYEVNLLKGVSRKDVPGEGGGGGSGERGQSKATFIVTMTS